MIPPSRPAQVSTILLALVGLCLSTWLPGCGATEQDCVVLIITDTTRSDRLGCAGYEAAMTPTLDSLATGGVRFATTVTAAPVTGPSITTILSGVLPPVHGVRDNARFTLSPNLTLLAEAFHEAGYQTGAVVAAIPLLARFGYDRGFDFYDDRFGEDPYRVHNRLFAAKEADLRTSERRGSAVTDRALAWLSGVDNRRPLFLLVHYFDPHYPYDPPPDLASRFPESPYDGEIAAMDRQIGRLLAGLRERLGEKWTIRVVVVGDHGEGLDDHEEGSHGFFIYDTTAKVPLIFNGPDCTAGLVVEQPVRTMDIAPTICAWCGLGKPETFAGQNLTPALAGGTIPAACDTALIETFWTQLHYNWSPLQGVRTSTWKWIKAPRPELYNLKSDPGETTNLTGAFADVVTGLGAHMERLLLVAAQRQARLGATDSDIDPQLDRQLQALGYVAGTGQRSLVPDFTLPDPKDGNRQWNREQERQLHLATASNLNRAGQAAEALRQLDLAAEIRPLAGKEAAMRGMLLHRSGQSADAVAAYQQALATETEPREEALSRLELIDILITLGRKADAEAQLDSLAAAPGLSADAMSAAADLRRRAEALR
jgi:choline-sulfatase